MADKASTALLGGTGGTFRDHLTSPRHDSKPWDLPGYGPMLSGGEIVAMLFGPAEPMPSQTTPRYDRPAAGERRLLVALLRDAIFLALQARRNRRHYEDRLHTPSEAAKARAWLASDERSAGTHFAFLDVCDHLGFEPDVLRAGIERLRRSHVSPLHIVNAMRVDSGIGLGNDHWRHAKAWRNQHGGGQRAAAAD